MKGMKLVLSIKGNVVSKVDRLEYAYAVYPILSVILTQSKSYRSDKCGDWLVPTLDSGDSTSQEQSLNKDSQSDDVLSEEEDDVSKETHNMAYISSDSYGQGQQNFQNGATNILPKNEETMAQAPQPELVACAPNPYYDPYYGGMMAAYGQHMVHPQFLDMHQVRMPLPLEMAWAYLSSNIPHIW
ncbi:nuclear transcription factor Y subunit A-9-like protein [Tanacetum coccineum]